MPNFRKSIIPKISNSIPATHTLHFPQLHQLLLPPCQEPPQRLPQPRPLKYQRNIIERTTSLAPQILIDLRNNCFQFRGNESPLSDYILFDARNTAHAEGGRACCACVKDKDGAVAAIVSGRIAIAALEGLEMLRVAA